MVERGHCHAQAGVAITRKLVVRVWSTITRGTPYQFRDLHGQQITRAEAGALARSLRVPADVRRRSRAHSSATQRGRLTR